MYIPQSFKQGNPKELKKAIKDYPFASLITQSKSGLEANHIPFILRENESKGKTVLQGHIAKANPLWQNVDNQSEVLTIFNGPNCYISPNHYPTKKESGKAVPTWNYLVVHVKGILSCTHDPVWIYNMINNLTNEHESGRPEPWSIKDAPEEYIQKMIPAIVGLEIDILSIEGKWKLSQNQPEQNQQGVIDGLQQENNSHSSEVAQLVHAHSKTKT